jgi:hypothetical protein
MPSSHTTVPTPNPSERALLVQIEESVIANNPSLIPVEGTLYRDFPEALLAIEYPVDLWGGYRYTEPMGDHGLLFAKGKTEDERNTPFRSIWKRFGNHRWDSELEALAFLQDANFPLSANIIRNGQQGIVTAPRPFVREIFIAEVNEGSRFLMDQFTSDVPYRISRFPVPQGQPISYDINGVRGSFPPSLHDDVEIPSTLVANATFFGGSAGAESSRIPGQFFPRTNFKRRRPYVLICEQELTNGVWYLERIRVFPPKRPKVTVQ